MYTHLEKTSEKKDTNMIGVHVFFSWGEGGGRLVVCLQFYVPL